MNFFNLFQNVEQSWCSFYFVTASSEKLFVPSLPAFCSYLTIVEIATLGQNKFRQTPFCAIYHTHSEMGYRLLMTN